MIHLVFILFLLNSQHAIGETHSRASLEEEATSLWKLGQQALQQNHDEDAILFFQRYIARYPGYSFYTKAQITLAELLLKTKKPSRRAEAIALLESFLKTATDSSLSFHGHLLLGQLYLQQKQNQSAYFKALELTERGLGPISSQRRSPNEMIQALLLRAEVEFTLGHLQKAHHFLNQVQARTEAGLYQDSILKLQLKFKLNTCKDILQKEILSETELFQITQDHALCFQEALGVYVQILKLKNSESLNFVTPELPELLKDAWDKKVDFCHHPFHKIHSNFSKLVKKSQSELKSKILEDCQQEWENNLNLLKDWKQYLPKEMLDKKANRLRGDISPNQCREHFIQNIPMLLPALQPYLKNKQPQALQGVARTYAASDP